ncbi:hypothetical protein [Streptomyces californicus]|uniref:hypothetical protein n=1 Tax=Streptomyces californicus TaxID=67351 RepID=UPI00371CBB2C
MRLTLVASAGFLALTGSMALAPHVEAAAGDAPVIVTSGWSGQAETAYAACPEGTSLVGGGYDSEPHHTGLGAIADAVNASAPSSFKPNTWAVRMDAGAAKAYAMCSKDSDQAPTVVTSNWSGPAETVYATCPQGTTLTGGGYDSQPHHTGFGLVSDAVNANAPSSFKPNTWAVRMDSGLAKSYAMCTK